jgi:hypothetical protein
LAHVEQVPARRALHPLLLPALLLAAAIAFRFWRYVRLGFYADDLMSSFDCSLRL